VIEDQTMKKQFRLGGALALVCAMMFVASDAVAKPFGRDAFPQYRPYSDHYRTGTPMRYQRFAYGFAEIQALRAFARMQ
jgi:hypothetical protein